MELQELSNRILKELFALVDDGRDAWYYDFTFNIDNHDHIFVINGDFAIVYDNVIDGLNINDAYIQFPDFEAEVKREYVSWLENQLNGSTLNF